MTDPTAGAPQGRRRREVLGSVGTALAAALAGCSGGSVLPPSNASDGEDDASADDGFPTAPVASSVIKARADEDGPRFDPAIVWLEVGGTATWEVTSGVHTVSAYHPETDAPRRVPEGADAFDSGELDPGATFERAFDEPGVYDYYCAPHRDAGAVGTVVVGVPEPDPAREPGLSEPAEDAPAAEAIRSLNERASRGLDGASADAGSDDGTEPAGEESGGEDGSDGGEDGAPDDEAPDDGPSDDESTADEPSESEPTEDEPEGGAPDESEPADGAPDDEPGADDSEGDEPTGPTSEDGAGNGDSGSEPANDGSETDGGTEGDTGGETESDTGVGNENGTSADGTPSGGSRNETSGSENETAAGEDGEEAGEDATDDETEEGATDEDAEETDATDEDASDADVTGDATEPTDDATEPTDDGNATTGGATPTNGGTSGA